MLGMNSKQDGLSGKVRVKAYLKAFKRTRKERD